MGYNDIIRILNINEIIMAKRTEVVSRERKAVEEFFDREITDIPELPNWVTNEHIAHWEDNLFCLHYLPAISLDHDLDLPDWTDRPAKAFYQKIKEGKLHPKAKELTGKWILIDGRDKPEQRVLWFSATDAKIVQRLFFDPKSHLRRWQKQQHEKEYLKDQLNQRGFGSRYCLTPADIHELKPFTADFLKLGPESTIRLPYFIEFNYLGNTAYPQWRTTKTWEWFQDQMDDGSHLAGGCQSVGIMGWDPADHWSTILGFRVVIEL